MGDAPRMEAALEIGNDFEQEAHTKVHKMDTLITVSAEREAAKAEGKK
jgi:hypothetical protein